MYGESRAHVWCATDLFPVLIFVVVRAQLRRLGAEIALINDAVKNIHDGELLYQFTTLQVLAHSIHLIYISNCLLPTGLLCAFSSLGTSRTKPTVIFSLLVAFYFSLFYLFQIASIK